MGDTPAVPTLTDAELAVLRQDEADLRAAAKQQEAVIAATLSPEANRAAVAYARPFRVAEMRQEIAGVVAYSEMRERTDAVRTALEAVGLRTDALCAVSAPPSFDRQPSTNDGLTVSRRLAKALKEIERGVLNPAPATKPTRAAKPAPAVEAEPVY